MILNVCSITTKNKPALQIPEITIMISFALLIPYILSYIRSPQLIGTSVFKYRNIVLSPTIKEYIDPSVARPRKLSYFYPGLDTKQRGPMTLTPVKKSFRNCLYLDWKPFSRGKYSSIRYYSNGFSAPILAWTR